MTDYDVRDPATWEQTWMDTAFIVARRSKDPSTQVGAVIVSPDNRAISVGYNGFPSQVYDYPEVLAGGQTEDGLTKYDLVIHAEVNAVLNCPCRPEGWTLFSTHLPCKECAKFIAGAGIARVVCPLDKGASDLGYAKTPAIMKAAGIQLVFPRM